MGIGRNVYLVNREHGFSYAGVTEKIYISGTIQQHKQETEKMNLFKYLIYPIFVNIFSYIIDFDDLHKINYRKLIHSIQVIGKHSKGDCPFFLTVLIP